MDFIPALNLTLTLFTVITNIILAWVVFVRNPKSASNRLISLLGIVMSIWTLVFYVSLQPSVILSPLLWIRFSIFLASPMTLLFFILGTTLPSDKLTIGKKQLYIFLYITWAVMIVAVSPYAFTNVEIVNGRPNPTPGPGLIVFGLYVISLSFYTFYKLITRLRRSSGIEKQQLRFINTGFFLMYGLLIGTIFLPVAIFQNTTFVPFASLYTLIFLLFTCYAIIKHHFLDIRIVVARTISFSVLIALFAFFYVFTFSTLSFSVIDSSIDKKAILLSTVLALLMVFTFDPIKKFIGKITNSIFFQDQYNTSILLHKLTVIMASTFNLDDLTKQLLKELVTQVKISKGAILLINNGNIYKIVCEGYPNDMQVDVNKVLQLMQENSSVSTDSLQEGELKDIMRKHDISIFIRLKTGNITNGLLYFGVKSSGEIYNENDIRVMEIFASEAGIAIQNALAFEQIQKFNQTLQAEVNKATENVKSINEDVYKKNFELKRVTDELAAANDKLQALDKLKDEFVSLASHELRTPMTAIKSYLWLFLEYNKAHLDGKEKLYIERAYEATDRLIALVNDMLNVSRIESGRMTIAFKPVNLIQLTKEVMEELSPTALKQKVELIVDAKDDLPPVRADQNKLREVMTNLIGNSLKFTDPGGSVTIRMHQDQGKVITDVIDTGKGIKEEDLPKLFQKFGIVGNNYLQKQSTQGTGLGLYISKSIVKLHGGDIWVKSDGENKGATFSFSLDINTDQQVEVEQPKEASEQNAPSTDAIPAAV